MAEPITQERYDALTADPALDWRKAEVQRYYRIGKEDSPYGRYKADRTVIPPDEVGWWADFLAMIRSHTHEPNHRLIQRLRITDDDPRPLYQQYLAAVAHWHVDAGEQIRHLPRPVARRIGFPLDHDRSLFGTGDTARLVVSRFTDGEIAGKELVTGPQEVARYAELWERAWRHAVPVAGQRAA